MRSIAAPWRCGFVRRARPVDEFESVFRARRRRIWQVFRRVIWRLVDRRLYDRGSLPDSSSPGSSLLSSQHWKRMVPARLRHGADLLDPSRFGRNAVQFFGSARKFKRGSNFERLLQGQPVGFQRRVEPRCAARRRHGCQCLKRVLARLGTEIQTNTPPGRCRQQVELILFRLSSSRRIKSSV